MICICKYLLSLVPVQQKIYNMYNNITHEHLHQHILNVFSHNNIIAVTDHDVWVAGVVTDHVNSTIHYNKKLCIHY